MSCDELIEFMQEVSQDIDSTLNGLCTAMSLDEPVLDIKLVNQDQTSEGDNFFLKDCFTLSLF